MTLVNGLLKIVIQKISVFERPATFISLQRNIAEKIFVSQFFNTAVSLVVVNAAIPELMKGVPLISDVLFNGNHRDFDQMWYKDIGGPLMITMLINTVAPIATLFAHETMASFKRCWGRCTAYTQRALNDAYMVRKERKNQTSPSSPISLPLPRISRPPRFFYFIRLCL